MDFNDPPGESIKAVGFACVWKSDAQSRHERRMQDDRCTLVPCCQVHRWHCTDTLPIEDDVLWGYAIPAVQEENEERVIS